uniref:uncharacterized protein LOC120333782 isoform X2 n=1 Tax=Styela clava TaxID=7725 RepID=UPI00193996CB|nr:uncharacterized protein LOC120333782 isoform X2 [Styela clava]
MTRQVNTRFAQNEEALRQVASRLNELSRSTFIQNQRLSEVIFQMVKERELRRQEWNFLQGEIDQNQRLLLRELDTFLHEFQTIEAMSVAELEVNQLVLHVLKNSTAKPLFDKTKAYLIRVKDGILHLKEYARLLTAVEEEANQTIQNNVRQAEEMRRGMQGADRELNEANELWVNCQRLSE